MIVRVKIEGSKISFLLIPPGSFIFFIGVIIFRRSVDANKSIYHTVFIYRYRRFGKDTVEIIFVVNSVGIFAALNEIFAKCFSVTSPTA